MKCIRESPPNVVYPKRGIAQKQNWGYALDAGAETLCLGRY